MPLDKSTLINFLTALDKETSREITLVAVGGTAMTVQYAGKEENFLYNLKIVLQRFF